MPSNCDAGEDSWESLGQQRDQTNLKGNPPWMLVGRTDAEAEIPVFWSSDANSWLIGKVTDAGKDWWQKEKTYQRTSWLNGITNATDMRLGKLWEMVRDGEACHASVHVVAKSWTWLGDWTTTTTNKALIVRDEAMKKGRQPQRRQITFIQARRGDSRSNDQAERAGSGRLHI